MKYFNKELACLALVMAIVISLYANATRGAFVWDDEHLIVNNAFIKGPGQLKAIFTTSIFYFIPTLSPPVYYRPFQALSYCFDYRLWGLNPFGYHVTNILLHLANILLVYVLLKYFFCRARVALLAVFLFGICPLHVSAVTYISGRADLLVLFFMCCALISFLVFLRTGKAWVYLVSMVSYVGALLSKEIAVIFPVLLLVTVWAAMKGGVAFPVKKKAKFYAGFFACSLFYAVLRAVFFNPISSEHSFGIGTLDFSSFVVFCKVVFSYFLLIVHPIGLHMQHMLGGSSGVFSLSSIIFILCFLGSIAVMYKKNVFLWWGLSWFLLALSPVLFLMLSYRSISPSTVMMAEHWIYIPLVGFFAALAHMVMRPMRSLFKILSMSCLFVLVIFYSFQLVRYNRDWVDDEHIYASTIKNEPSNSMVKFYLAFVHVKMGLFGVATSEFNSLLDAKDAESYRAHEGLGNIAFMKRDFDKALGEYDFALKDISSLKSAPEKLTNQMNSKLLRLRGTVYFNKGLFEEARQDFVRSVEFNNRNYVSIMSLGVLCAREKNFDQAIQYFLKSLDLFPYNAEVYHFLARVYADKGDIIRSKQAQEKVRLLGGKQ